MLELRPELVLVRQLIVQFHLNDAQTVLRIRYGLFLLYLFISKDVFLQRFRHLFLHLLRGHTRIDGNDDTLTDGKVGELVLIDVRKAIDA